MTKIFLSLAAVALCCTVQAQTTPTITSQEEVTVTATKTAKKQNETGKVVTIISKETIERNAGKTLGQLLNTQVGVTIAGALNSPGSNQTVFMRGASSGRTLILLDGIPVSDPSLIGAEFDLNLLSLQNVERIELCRGAQSTLYGSDAVAGVINIITKQTATTKAIGGNALLSYGSFGTLNTNVQLHGAVKKMSYSIRAGNTSSKGFSSAHDSTGIKNFDNDKYNNTTVNAQIRYAFTEQFTAKAFLQNTHYNTSLDASIFSDEKDFTLHNKNLIAGTGFEYKKAGVQVTGNYQYSDIHRKFLNDSIDKPGFAKYVTDHYFGKNQFLELYSNINLGSGFSLLQGADYRFANMNSQYYSLSSFGPYTAETKDSVQSQASAYASVFYTTPNKKFNLEVGGRLNVHSRYGTNNTYTINPSYNFSNKFRAFASLASGFKAPTLYQLYSSYGNLQLQPESSKNYELGAQYTVKNINARAVFFNRDLENAIDFNNINFKYFNIIKQTVSGLELELNATPTEKLTLTANYTYLKTEELSQSRQTFKDTTYTHLLRRPNHVFNLTAGYQLAKNLFANISLKTVGARYDVGGYKKQDIKLDNYLLLGAYAEYTYKSHLKVFVDAQNLTNTKFFDIRGYNSIPTVLNFGVRFSW